MHNWSLVLPQRNELKWHLWQSFAFVSICGHVDRRLHDVLEPPPPRRGFPVCQTCRCYAQRNDLKLPRWAITPKTKESNDMTAAAGKRNTELPGFERPTITALDKKFAPYLELRDEHISLTRKLKDAKTLWQDELAAQRDKLEKDGAGDPVYVYRDGKRTFRLAIEAGDESITCSEVKAKKGEDDDGGAIG
jgi:hypothetical protein